jgi:hypothetical protein
MNITQHKNESTTASLYRYEFVSRNGLVESTSNQILLYQVYFLKWLVWCLLILSKIFFLFVFMFEDYNPNFKDFLLRILPLRP